MNSSITKTSREGNNQSTSQSFINAYLARRKREEIDRFMDILIEWIDSPSVTDATGGGKSSRPTNGGPLSSSTSSPPPKSTGQKRPLRRDSFDDSGSSQNDFQGSSRERKETEKKSRIKRPKVERPLSRNLACPFFQRDPAEYSKRSACTGPGYSNMSRLKEHIYRAHKQPDNKCNRCCKVFSNKEQLKEHQRAIDPCKVSREKSTDGIDDSQYDELRKKPSGKKSNVERWEDVYRVIFPGAKTIPPCYYSYNDKHTPEYGDEEIPLTEYFENELIEGVRNDLEDRFEKFAEDTKVSFMDIVKRQCKRIQKKFNDQRKALKSSKSSGASKTPVPVPPPVTQCADFDFPEYDFNSLTASAVNYFDPSLLDMNGNDIDFPAPYPDSAYWSMGSPKSPGRI